ncbi:MAG: DUF2953 domain-containing protein [Lachnospiraceae bacterium]|nr:DUF2953 domain-containing protein [Lachnospiraceae bacterium]
MELILLILKIILIALFVVLGLILLALGVILFVPIRYEVSGDIGDAWTVRIKGKVSYLLSAVKVLFSYEEAQFNAKLFLFGFEKKIQEDVETVPETEDIEADAEITFHEKTPHAVAEQTSQDSIAEPEPETEEPEKPKKTKQKKTKTEKKQSQIDIAFIKQQLTDEHNKSAVRKIWSELCYLFKHFKFRKIVTDLVFATGDPATTGQTLGILCMIPMLYRYNFKVVPDFEADDPYVKGTFLIAGKVRLIHILMTVLRLIFAKEVRIVIKRILRVLEQ